MIRLPLCAVTVSLCLAVPALAQEPAAQPAPVAEQEVEDDGDWGISDFLARQAAAEARANPQCATSSDMLATQSTARPRYDANGALIREQPASCQPAAAVAMAAPAAPAEEGPGGTMVRRQQQCTETGTTRTCSGSVTFGNSTAAMDRAEELARGQAQD